MLTTRVAVGCGILALSMSCSDEEKTKSPKGGTQPDASGTVDASGARSGAAGAGGSPDAGSSGRGGAGAGGAAATGGGGAADASAGAAGSGGAAAAGGDAGSAGSRDAAGGTAGAAAAGATAGADAAGGAAGADAAGGTAGAATGGTAGVASCSLGEACCAGGTCTGGYRCAGATCSCIESMHGDHDLRTDGTIIYDQNGLKRVIEEAGTFGMPLTGMTHVYEGHWHACGARNDGTAWCWPKSSNASGYELGNGTTGGVGPAWAATQVVVAGADGGPPAPLTGVVKLSERDSRCYLGVNTCAIKGDGTLWCWGSRATGGGSSTIYHGIVQDQEFAFQMQESPGVPLTGVDAVSLGTRHVCALRSGDVYCWGANVGGPLGQGNQTSQSYPAKVTLPAAAQQIGAGADVTCALVGDRVYCWGSNNSGQVGIGDPAANTDGCINYCKLTPRAVIDGSATPITGVTDISVGYIGVCAKKSDHSLWCWGQGLSNVAVPLTVGASPVDDVALFANCGAGFVHQTIRFLTRNAELHDGTLTIPQTCP